MLNRLLQSFLRLLFHAILVCTILGGVIMIIKTTLHGSGRAERFFRGLAALVGIATYFVMRMLGLTVTQPLLDKLSSNIWYLLLGFGVILPAGCGAAITWAMDHFYKKDDVIKVRLFVFVSALLLVIFTDTYVQVLSASGDVDHLLLPNLAFALGMGFYVLLRVKSKPVYY